VRAAEPEHHVEHEHDCCQPKSAFWITTAMAIVAARQENRSCQQRHEQYDRNTLADFLAERCGRFFHAIGFRPITDEPEVNRLPA
jgi:hypothetical protein